MVYQKLFLHVIVLLTPKPHACQEVYDWKFYSNLLKPYTNHAAANCFRKQAGLSVIVHIVVSMYYSIEQAVYQQIGLVQYCTTSTQLFLSTPLLWKDLCCG